MTSQSHAGRQALCTSDLMPPTQQADSGETEVAAEEGCPL